MTPFDYMQKALDIVGRSPHPTNKIAACLFFENREYVVHTNHWPEPIAEKIGKDKKVGNSSGTVHAETACIVQAPQATEGASICITDPFCPNCAKNIAEAGIRTIYLDDKGFDKDFFKRRGGDFDRMSLRICERAGINLYGLNMETKEIRNILLAPKNYKPVEDSPIDAEPIESVQEGVFSDIIQRASEKNQRRKFSVALVQSPKGTYFALTARAHAVIGYSMEEPEEVLDLLTPIGKYSFIQEPVNRLMMYLARKGHKLQEGYFYCSQVPTSREQVNLVAAGIQRITIGNTQKCRDTNGLEAMQQLKAAGIINYS